MLSTKISKFTQNVIDIQGCLALISAFNSLIFVLINLVYVLHHPNTRIKKQLRFPCHKHCKHHSWSKLCKYVFVLCLCHVHFKYIDRKVDWFMHMIMKMIRNVGKLNSFQYPSIWFFNFSFNEKLNCFLRMINKRGYKKIIGYIFQLYPLICESRKPVGKYLMWIYQYYTKGYEAR